MKLFLTILVIDLGSHSLSSVLGDSSLIGSLLIIVAYAVARPKSTPKSAFLILHLAISDFFWFLAGAVMSTLWIANNGSYTTFPPQTLMKCKFL